MDFRYYNLTHWFIKYSNALSFKHISEKEIKGVEAFVRSELIGIILKRCQTYELQFEEKDKKYFFDIYESDPEKFEFKDGYINLVLEIVDFVKRQLNQYGIEYFQNSSRRKVQFHHSSKLSLGMFFARKENLLQLLHQI